MGLICVGDEAFNFLGRFITNGFNVSHMPRFASALMDEKLSAFGTIGFRNGFQQIRGDEDPVRSGLGRHQDDAGWLRLIPKPFAGRRKDKD